MEAHNKCHSPHFVISWDRHTWKQLFTIQGKEGYQGIEMWLKYWEAFWTPSWGMSRWRLGGTIEGELACSIRWGGCFPRSLCNSRVSLEGGRKHFLAQLVTMVSFVNIIKSFPCGSASYPKIDYTRKAEIPVPSTSSACVSSMNTKG